MAKRCMKNRVQYILHCNLGKMIFNNINIMRIFINENDIIEYHFEEVSI